MHLLMTKNYAYLSDKPWEQNFAVVYNHVHNILRYFDILPNYLFTTSEKMREY